MAKAGTIRGTKAGGAAVLHTLLEIRDPVIHMGGEERQLSNDPCTRSALKEGRQNFPLLKRGLHSDFLPERTVDGQGERT